MNIFKTNIKKAISATLITLAVSTSAIAQPTQDVCIEFSEIAKDFMIQRQNGESLSKVLTSIDKALPEEGRKPYKDVAIMAWRVPLYEFQESR